MAKNPSRVVWMLKNGDMVVKKNLILVILDSRRIFMLGLPFDDSNFFKNFEYFFSSKILFFQKIEIFTCKMKNSHFRDIQNRRLLQTECLQYYVWSRGLMRVRVGGSTWLTWHWVSTWWDGLGSTLLESTLLYRGDKLDSFQIYKLAGYNQYIKSTDYYFHD